MIIAKKMLVICALSSAGFLGAMESYDYKKSAAAEERTLEEKVKVAVIDREISKLQEEGSRINEAIKKRYGDSTIAYRAASTASCSDINKKLAKLRNEKVGLQSKL